MGSFIIAGRFTDLERVVSTTRLLRCRMCLEPVAVSQATIQAFELDTGTPAAAICFQCYMEIGMVDDVIIPMSPAQLKELEELRRA